MQGHLRLPLLRIGLEKGLFEELRSPLAAGELTERLGLAPDLLASWLRAVNAHGLVRCSEGRYQIGGFVRWLLDAEEAPAIRALLDHTALTYVSRLDEVSELMQGGERPDVTIVMPVLNEVDSLPHCIGNALEALLDDFEAILMKQGRVYRLGQPGPFGNGLIDLISDSSGQLEIEVMRLNTDRGKLPGQVGFQGTQLDRGAIVERPRGRQEDEPLIFF